MTPDLRKRTDTKTIAHNRACLFKLMRIVGGKNYIIHFRLISTNLSVSGTFLLIFTGSLTRLSFFNGKKALILSLK